MQIPLEFMFFVFKVWYFWVFYLLQIQDISYLCNKETSQADGNSKPSVIDRGVTQIHLKEKLHFEQLLSRDPSVSSRIVAKGKTTYPVDNMCEIIL